ncbi:hypothetical protein [Halorubrum sp. DTA98]|uniref:hypothetical protein n=1 Tax=Halorubrum sp. DTA98 TaxID=3402163 RepID=UPI003AADD7A4
MTEFGGWEFLIQAKVNNGQMIRLPEQVQQTVATNHLTKGPSIFWSIENENRYIVLSESPLEKDSYTNIGVYKIYDIDELDAEAGRIRPPKEISSVWAADPRPGERVFYLTHKQMLRGKKSSAYLLSESQVLDLLPSRNTKSRTEGMTDSLFGVPGFDSSE